MAARTFCNGVNFISFFLAGTTYSHHGTTAGSRNEDLGSIDLVLGDGPLDHVRDGAAVAAAVVGQGGLAADIPAGSRVGRAGVDDNEAILLCKLGVGAAGVVGLGGTSAVVDSHNNTGLGRKLLGHVDEESSLGGRGAEVGHLGEGSRCNCALGNRGGGSRRHGKNGSDSSEETHGERVTRVDVRRMRGKFVLLCRGQACSLYVRCHVCAAPTHTQVQPCDRLHPPHNDISKRAIPAISMIG